MVEGHGQYSIEVTNVVNANTMQMQPLFPSLMSSDNLFLAQSHGLSQQIKNKRAEPPKRQIEAQKMQIKKEYLPKVLKEVFK